MFDVRQPSRRAPQMKFASLIQPAYKKDYKIPILPHQEHGMFFRGLWTTQPSVLRIIPGHDEQGNMFPQVINADVYAEPANPSDYLSGTFCSVNTVLQFGDSKSDLITDLPPDSEDRMRFPTSPIREFVQTIYNSVQLDKKIYRASFKLKPADSWRVWTAKQGQLTFPKDTFMFQALIFTCNGRSMRSTDGADLVDENGYPLPLFGVIGINHRVSANELKRALTEPKDPAFPPSGTNTKYGSLAELESNLLYLNVAVDTTQAAKGFGGSSPKFLKPSVQDASASGWTPTPYPLDEATCKSLWIPWMDLLKFMSAAEQVEYLAQEFGADTVNYVIGTNPVFAGLEIPSEIANVGLGQYASMSKSGSAYMPAQRIEVSTAKPTGLPGIGVRAAAPRAPAPRAPMAAPTVPGPRPMGSFAQSESTYMAAPAAAAAPSSIGSTVDRAKLKAELARLRGATASATATTESDTSSLAGSIMANIDSEEDSTSDEQ